jgi:hypothetical protein
VRSMIEALQAAACIAAHSQWACVPMCTRCLGAAYQLGQLGQHSERCRKRTARKEGAVWPSGCGGGGGRRGGGGGGGSHVRGGCSGGRTKPPRTCTIMAAPQLSAPPRRQRRVCFLHTQPTQSSTAVPTRRHDGCEGVSVSSVRTLTHSLPRISHTVRTSASPAIDDVIVKDL